MLLVVVILLLQVASLSEGMHFWRQRPLCDEKFADLYRMADLNKLAEEIESTDCSNRTKSAFHELKTMIETESENVCSASKIESIVKFYKEFISTEDPEKEKTNKELPKSLVKFAVAYGLQVNNLCKKNMVNVLKNRVSNLLDYEDFARIRDWIEGESPLRVLWVGQPDDIFLPEELFNRRVFPVGWLKTVKEAHVVFGHLQQTCKRRFEPIYKPMLLPLVRLANLGFNYKDKELKDQLNWYVIRKEVAYWPKIAFLCELVNGNTYLADYSATPETSHDSEKATDEVEPRVRELLERLRADAAALEEVKFDAKFKVSLADPVINAGDAELSTAIDKFKTSRTERTNSKKRLRRAFFAAARSGLKQFGLRSLFWLVDLPEDYKRPEEFARRLQNIVRKELRQKMVAYQPTTKTVFTAVFVIVLLGGLIGGFFGYIG
jgi:hypothetical protein